MNAVSEDAPGSDPSTHRLDPLDPARLTAALTALDGLHADEEAYRRRLLELLLGLTHGVAAAYVVADEGSAYAVGPTLLSPQIQAWLGAPEQAFAEAAAASLTVGALAVLPAAQSARARVLAVPARRTGHVLVLVCAEHPSAGVMIVLQLLAAGCMTDPVADLALTQLAGRLRDAASESQALTEIAAAVSARTPATSVLCVCRRDPRAPAMFGGGGRVAALDRRGGIARELLAVYETCSSDGMRRWSGAEDDADLGPLAAQLGATRLVIFCEDCGVDAAGRLVVCVAGHGPSALPEGDLAQFVAMAAPLLALRLDGFPSLPTRAVRRLRGTSGRRRVAAVAASVIVLSAIGAWPVADHVPAEVELAPALQRVLAAPFDTLLAETWVRAGDRVTAGQAVIRLDGRELELEQQALASELAQLEQRLASRLAAGATDDVMHLRLERRKAALRLALIEERLDRLTLTSPLDGVVLSVGLEKQLGRAFTTGQPLMEIAPLAAMRAELRFDVSDIARVTPGAAVRVMLDGSGNGALTAQVARIRPRAETGETGNYFVAEAVLDNAGDALRPGLTGRADIAAGETPLAWRLLRKPVEALRRWRGW